MKQPWFQIPLWIGFLVALFGLTFTAPGQTVVLAQASTPSPTATSGTAADIFATVISTEPQINVRGGPSSVTYPVVGFLLQGAVVPALGRSPGGDWIQIVYREAAGGVGWVYSPLVSVSPGFLQIIEPPPTPIPPATSTIDPTLAAQFNTVPTSTRLPTFTPPAASLIAPSFAESTSASGESGIPMGVVILVFASTGSIGLLVSLLARR